MPVNLDKVSKWKDDIASSVDMYNAWFMEFAPAAFRNTRLKTTVAVEDALKATKNLTNIEPALIRSRPEILSTLRMSTCPPIAVDRLIGLAGVSSTLVKAMEQHGRLPFRMSNVDVDKDLLKISAIIKRLADPDILFGLGVQFRPLKLKFTVRQRLLQTAFAALLQIRLFETPKKNGNSLRSRCGLRNAVIASSWQMIRSSLMR